MKKSTKNIIKMHGWRVDRAAHNYIYFVFYELYVKVFLGAGRLVAKWFGSLKASSWAYRMVFNRYHAKVITLGDATKILSLKEDLIIGPDRTERIIPFKLANKIILKEPEFIAVMDCPCRTSREKHCEPVNVCIAVGRTTAEFWLEHCQKYNVRKIGQGEALKIVRDARDRGCINTAWFKVATGGRTGVICSCCSCCCGGLEGMRIAKSLKYGAELGNIIPSGYTVIYDADKCDTCGTCAKVCMFGAIKPDENGNPVYDKSACMGCGICVEKCQGAARSLSTDFAEEYPLDIDLIIEKAGRDA